MAWTTVSNSHNNMANVYEIIDELRQPFLA